MKNNLNSNLYTENNRQIDSLHSNNWNKTLFKDRKEKKSFLDKFINIVMKHGEKAKAYKILSRTAFFLQKKIDISKKNIESLSIILSDEKKKIGISGNFSHICEINKQPFDILLRDSIQNVKPSIEVRKVRRAGTTYQVPALLSTKRQETLAIRWIVEGAKKRKHHSNKSFSECLAQELFDAYNKQGQARQKRDELHKIAELNRAYIRYRWW